MKLKHGIPTALKQFDLIAGAGSEDSKKACAMTLLAWCAGREWTDAPPCAHPVLRGEVIAVNDDSATTAEMRARLVRAGRDGILDTWWVPVRVVLWAFSYEKDEKPSEDRFERLLRALGRVAEWKARSDRGLPGDFDLSRANLSGADLSGADLFGADLSGADLSRANLSRANLSRADLSRANLSRANLSGAYLSGADLFGAYLSGADLSGADLSGADLSGAYLSGADLFGAYLSGADLSGADLSGADLSRAAGTPLGGMPDGWKLDSSGLWVKS